MEDVRGLGARGATVQLALMPTDVTVAEELDTFMVEYKPAGFRADEIAPIQLVGKDTGFFRIFGVNNAFRPVNVLSSIQADIPEVDPESTTDTYLVQERALGSFIPAVTQTNADEGLSSWDPKAAALNRISWALSLERETRVFGVLKDPTSWNAAMKATIAAGAEWNDASNGDPMLDLFDRIEASAQPVNGIWLNPTVAHALLRSESVRSYMKTMIGDSANSSQVAAAAAAQNNMDFQIPGLPPFHIVASKVLNETTGGLDFILDDTVILTAGGNGSGIQTATTFRRKGPSGTGFTTREFNLERRGLNGGVFLASGHAEQVKMIASTVGGLILDVLQ